VRSVIEAALDRCGVTAQTAARAFAETLGALALKISMRKRPSYRAAGRNGWPLSRHWCSIPTFCCSTSPPTISIFPESRGSKTCLRERHLPRVIVSHDRYFLENVHTDMVELNRIYPDGSLRVHGNYSQFLEKKEEFLHAQSKRQEALENLVHGEIEWLRRGAKARTRSRKLASARLAN